MTTAPHHGSVSVADDGTYTYSPDAAYAHAGGADSSPSPSPTSSDTSHNHTLDRFLEGITAGLARRGLTTAPAPYSTNTITVVIAASTTPPP